MPMASAFCGGFPLSAHSAASAIDFSNFPETYKIGPQALAFVAVSAWHRKQFQKFPEFRNP
jgi:hypothetical protein